MAEQDQKKQEFLNQKMRYKGPNRVIILVFVLIAVIAVGVVLRFTGDDVKVPRRWEGGNYNVGHPEDYKDQTISMTDTKLQLVDGKYQLSLDEVEKAKLIFAPTDDLFNGRPKAVTAFITPAGRLVVAIAMCEPCRSERFHIEGNILVCDTCGTRWQLNDLRGISGGCPQYAPEEMPYEVNDGIISFDPSLVKQWEPRI